MKQKCYFCDAELEAVVHTFKVGLKEEPVCDSCDVKTVNRRKAAQDGAGSPSLP
ncbi:MAG: hypothetical protein JRM80_03635 [Nitrososphaerota archaeon]|nr:hypothetical protein [Nitrososphaerota archaeon]